MMRSRVPIQAFGSIQTWNQKEAASEKNAETSSKLSEPHGAYISQDQTDTSDVDDNMDDESDEATAPIGSSAR